MADSKEALINNIKEWIAITNKMNDLQKAVKDLRIKKKNISISLINIMESNEIDGIDIKNGKLVYKKTKVKAPINKDYLLLVLDSYFKKNPEIDTQDVGKYILENRPIKETPTLSIKQNK
tara:strand:- start:2221 stop:2580 length:360 start_codon:yes stop_codon:yes gene_type:complete